MPKRRKRKPKICDHWRSHKKDDVIDSAYDVIQAEQEQDILFTYSHVVVKIPDKYETNKIKEHLCEVPTFKKNNNNSETSNMI